MWPVRSAPLRPLRGSAHLHLRPVRPLPTLLSAAYAAYCGLFGRRLQGKVVLVHADPPRSVRLEANGMGVRAWYVTSFAPTPAGTRLTVVGDYDVPIRILP